MACTHCRRCRPPGLLPLPQVLDFLAYTEDLWERFRTGGPGLPTVELPVGLDLLHHFQEELEAALKTREQLVLAEKLFDMTITAYPQLAQVGEEGREGGMSGWLDRWMGGMGGMDGG